jgi:hypothetical protein
MPPEPVRCAYCDKPIPGAAVLRDRHGHVFCCYDCWSRFVDRHDERDRVTPSES